MNAIRFCLLLSFFASTLRAGEDDEVIAIFAKSDARITKNAEGRVIKLMSPGKPPHTVAELQRIGELKDLEQLALNAPPGGDDDWSFLSNLKNLDQLTIWHGKEFSSLAPFSDLAIEGLTVGGCMGIRDLNKDDPKRQRDAVLSLRNLPNLKRLNLYHSPLVPDDSHLAHIASEFPLLEELKIDLAAPRNSETNISPDGLRKLKILPLKVLSLETVKSLTPDHMKAIAEMESLEAVLLDARREEVDLDPLVAVLKKAAPDLEVVASEKGGDIPRRSRK